MNDLDKGILFKEAGIKTAFNNHKAEQKKMFNEMKEQELDVNLHKIRKNKIRKDVAEKIMRDGYATSADDLRAVLRTLERSK